MRRNSRRRRLENDAEASATADDSRSLDSGGQSRAASAQDDNLIGEGSISCSG